MRQNYAIVLFIACALFFSGCCTKVECLGTLNPLLDIHFSGYSAQELRDRKIYIYDVISQQTVDSVVGFGEETSYYLFANSNGRQMRDCSFEIITGGKTYIIDQVTYHTGETKIACNKCFLADGRQTVATYDNFEFMLDGKLMKNTSQITLSK